MVNRYFQPTSYQPEFYTPPVEDISKAMEYAQQQYNTNYALTEQIRANQINALDPDKKRAQELQATYDSKVNDIVSKYSGDYSRATKDLNALLSEMKKQYRPGGEIHAIQDNHARYVNWEKEEQERVKSGKVTSGTFNKGKNYIRTKYTGIGDINPETGSYSTLNTIALPEYVDETKLAMDSLDKLKPRKISRLTPRIDKDGRVYNVTEEVEGIDQNEATLAVQQTLLSDNKWMELASFDALMDGKNPREAIKQKADSLVQATVPLRSGIFNDTYKEEYKGLDELTKLRLQQAHDMRMESQKQANRVKLEQFKHKLENPEEDFDQLEQLGINQNSGIKFNKIGPGYTTSRDLNLSIPGTFTKFNVGKYQSTQDSYPNVLTALQTGSTGTERVNAVALQKAMKETQGKPASATWERYNQIIETQSDFGNAIYYKPSTQPKQMAQGAQTLVPRVLGGNFEVQEYVDGKLVKLTPDEVNTAFSAMYDKDAKGNATKISPTVVWQGQTRSYAGDAPLGDLLSHGPRKFIVSSKSERMQEYNNIQRKDIFGHISTGETYSKPFGMFDGSGNEILSIGVNDYSSGSDTPDVSYYRAERDAFGRVMPVYNDPWKTQDGRRYRPADVEENLIGRQSRSLLPKRLGNDKNPTYEYIESER